MSENFFPRAYQDTRRNTSPVTRLLQEMPDQVALEALNSLNWFEPVGYLDHIYVQDYRLEGRTAWTHPLNAVIWTKRPALAIAAIDKASQAVANLKVSTVAIQADRDNLFMNNWVSQLVVHQAAQYAAPEVLEHLLATLKTHKEGHNYLPVGENTNHNLWKTLGWYGSMERPVKEWQKIIRLIDQQVMEEHPCQTFGKDGQKRQNIYQKRQRREHHNLLFKAALEGGNDALAEAVQGLRQVDVPLYSALLSALQHDNAGSALRVLKAPPTIQRVGDGCDIDNFQTNLARNLGKATEKWRDSRLFVRQGLEAEEVRATEINALQQLTVFLVSDLKNFPLLLIDGKDIRPGYDYDDTKDELTPLLGTDPRLSKAPRQKDLPMLMAPALALLTEEQVSEVGIEWTQWPAQTDHVLQGLPTLAEWMVLPECPWKTARRKALEQAMNDPDRKLIYPQRLREEMAHTKVDWNSAEGKRAAELVTYMFSNAPNPVDAAQAWWELHSSRPTTGTAEDAARRQAWLVALLPPPSPAKPKLRF